MTAPTESADLTGGMCHLQGTAQGTGHWHQAGPPGPTWDASAPWRSLCSQLLFQPRVLCSELGLPPPHLTHTHLEPPRPPTPLLAVPSLAPPEEAIIENGPSDSIRIQSPRENRGGGRGGGSGKRGTTHSSSAGSPRTCCTSRGGGGEKGTVLHCHSVLPLVALGPELGVSWGRPAA